MNKKKLYIQHILVRCPVLTSTGYTVYHNIMILHAGSTLADICTLNSSFVIRQLATIAAAATGRLMHVKL